MNDEKRLGTESIPKLMLQLSLPMIVAQLINVLYNLVDRMYIGRIEGVGALALTGLGLCFPIIMVISAFSSFAGAGGAPLAAIELGKQNRPGADKILGNAMTLIIGFSITLTLFFAIFKEPLLMMFGASEATIGFSMDYLSIYLVGTIFVQIALGLNPYIASQGQSKIAMMSVLIGAITNIILDPIFIFGLNMGVKGAALATIISQAISAIWILRFLTSEKSAIRIRKENLKPDGAIIGKIASLGVSPFIMQSTESLVVIVFNTMLQKYGGDLYVGSMTVLQSVVQLLIVPINGFSMGVQPLISYNFGARRYDRVCEAIRRMIVIASTGTVLFCGLAITFPWLLSGLFTNDQGLLDILNTVMPIFLAGMTIFGVQMTAQCTFVGLGRAKHALFVAALRKIILLVPLIFILSSQFGLMGIYYAEPIADFCSATTAGILLFFTYKELKGLEN